MERCVLGRHEVLAAGNDIPNAAGEDGGWRSRSTHAHRLVASCGCCPARCSSASTPPGSRLRRPPSELHMEISATTSGRREESQSCRQYAAQEVLRFRGGTSVSASCTSLRRRAIRRASISAPRPGKMCTPHGNVRACRGRVGRRPAMDTRELRDAEARIDAAQSLDAYSTSCRSAWILVSILFRGGNAPGLTGVLTEPQVRALGREAHGCRQLDRRLRQRSQRCVLPAVHGGRLAGTRSAIGVGFLGSVPLRKLVALLAGVGSRLRGRDAVSRGQRRFGPFPRRRGSRVVHPRSSAGSRPDERGMSPLRARIAGDGD